MGQSSDVRGDRFGIAVAAILALAAIFSLVIGPSTASATVPQVGEIRTSAPHAGGGALLVPVRYRLEQSGRAAAGQLVMRAPNGVKVRRSWRDRLHSGALRSPDRRRSFGFVHAVPLGPALTRALNRHGSSFALSARVVAEASRPGARPVRSARRQAGLTPAGASMCSTVPLAILRASSRGIRLPAPRCGAPVRWSVQSQASLGVIQVSGSWLSSRAGRQRVGSDSAVLVGRLNGRPVARQAVHMRVRPAGSGAVSVVAMGDSVTAGFGYFGSTGREMSITQLLDCRPGNTTYNDACSSNSSNTSNVGTALNFLPDYGLSRNISWAAQWANRFGITDYHNYAVSGSAPVDWLPGGQFAWLADRIKGSDPDYIVMTMGANPLLSDMLFGIDNMGCAIESDLFGDYKECIERAFDSVDLSGRLNSLYSELLDGTDTRLILMQYHLSIPSSALAYSAAQIEMMGQMLNAVIAEQAAAVSEDRIMVVAPPRFFVGIDMRPLYPSSYSCSWLGYKVDGRSVQSTPTQDELLVDHPLSFCSGPAVGPPWVISGDTGIHPSVAGYARMASRLPAP